MTLRVDWYCRTGVDPWQLCACDEHGAELIALGFARGVRALRAGDVGDVAGLGDADRCAICRGSTTLVEVRACCCHVLGTPCRVHRPRPAGPTGAWSRVRCTKCGAELQLPADRIAFERSASIEGLVVAVDVTGWARRNGGGDELCCPFHGEARYGLEHVYGPGGADEHGEDDELDEFGDGDELGDDEQLH